MPIQNTAPVVAPILPVTGADPTAAAVVPVVIAPVVERPLGVLPDGSDPLKVLTTANAGAATVSPTPTIAVGAGSAGVTEAGAASGDVVGNADGTPLTSDAAGDAAGSSDAGAPAVELTGAQKLAAKIGAKELQIIKLTAEVERLRGQYRSADLLDGVKAGSIIKARVGRADTAREVTASVVGVQTLEPSGELRYKIFFGEGFDAETVVIQASQIVDVVQV